MVNKSVVLLKCNNVCHCTGLCNQKMVLINSRLISLFQITFYVVKQDLVRSFHTCFAYHTCGSYSRTHKSKYVKSECY